MTMLVKISNDIKVQNYTSELLHWCKQNLILDNPDYYIAEKSGRYLGNIEQHLYLYEIRGDKLVIPFGCIKSVWSYIKNSSISYDFASLTALEMKGSILLYDYQERAVEALVKVKSGILQAPCGSGKTQIGIALASALNQKTLWLTHTSDLLKQSQERAKEYFDGDFGTITAGKVDIGKDITFATVQTMTKLDLQKYAHEWNVIIVDECHRIAGSPTKVMQFYKVLTNLKARHKFGLSATLERVDGMIKSTFAVIGDIVHTITNEEVGTKIIQSEHQRINTEVEQSEDYLDTDGTLDYNGLMNYLMKHKLRNRLITQYLVNNQDKYNIILSHRVEHLTMLKANLDYLGVSCEIVHSGVTKKKRFEIYEKMRLGEVHYIFATYSLAKEGLDIPILNRLYLVTPNKNKSIVIQSAGRIERNFDGKVQPVIFDFVDKKIGYCNKMFTTRRNILKKRWK